MGVCIRALMIGLVFVMAASARAQVPSPSEHLGREAGGHFTLADWNEVSGYYHKLAEASPRVNVSVEGKTTEGRDFVVAVISSEANLANLDEIRRHAAAIADPRNKTERAKREAIEQGKVVLIITPAMHATEAAGTQFGMAFAHQLATSDEEPWKSARENIVVVMPASLNPDGLDHVVEWYRQNVNTPYEAASLPKLYQFYTGHDNNRDWFMLTQAETRNMTRLIYSVWHPQIYWDVHQQGSDSERLFVPPYRDPLNPNLDPGIIAGINLIGNRAVMDMTREGYSGVATGVSYDMWWAGGNRNIPVRHNIIGILTEAASVNIASPIFQERGDLKPPHGKAYGPSNQYINPWPGGWWRIGDIIEYELAFGRSLLGTINREPRMWLSNAMEAAERSIAKGQGEGVRGWIIPADNRDPAAVRRLIDALMQTAVEVHVSEAEIEADGRTYPAGSIVIRRDQPYGAHAKDLFDIQRYPEGEAPYDVAGWSLPLLMGVRRVEVMSAIDAELKRVNKAEEAVAAFKGDPRLADNKDAIASGGSDAWTQVVEQLKEEKKLNFITHGEREGLIVPQAGGIKGVLSGVASKVSESSIELTKLPRIGVYAPWTGSMDEGWLRYVLDTWQVPYTRMRNEMIRAGELGDMLDVLIIADYSPSALQRGRPFGSAPEEMTGGLSPEGSIAVEEFVRNGGTLITFKNASKWAIDLMQIPLVDVTTGDAAKGFSCPGSVLRGLADEQHALTAGLPDSVPLFFSNALAWREMTRNERDDARLAEKPMQTLLRYAPTELLLSGYIAKPEVIEGRMAWVRVEHGEGQVHLFGFQPHYRAWAQSTFPLIFRAALLEQ